MFKRLVTLVVLAVPAVGLPVPAQASDAPSCASLVRTYRIPGAVTHVEKASMSDGTCAVEGYVEPAVRFQLRLPVSTWSGRYLQYGCDGLCGVFPPGPSRTCGPSGGDMAVAVTDDGHVSRETNPYLMIMDGTWAAHDQAARDDFFFRAPHVVSVASKRIIQAFYGRAAVHSYFSGCSTGGREGLLLAQRYPHDFDGILAGSPTNVMGPLGLYHAWLSKMNLRPDGTPILTADRLPALHNAVLAACDGIDGLVDEQIDDPRACAYDPVQLQCPAAPVCLTPEQVGIVRQLYRGPVSEGRLLYPGWESRGSELAWDGVVTPDSVNGLMFLAPLPDNYLRYVGYPIGRPASSLASVRFTVPELRRLTPEGVKGNAMNPDLSAFRRAGGKLLLWHPFDDHTVPAVGTIDYYSRVVSRSGGLAATQRFARLFLVPTMYHCALGSYKLNTVDPFPALVDWVEHDTAPTRLIASQQSNGQVLRTRPVFPYPLRARYDGTGSIDDAANFGPALGHVDGRIRWAGEDLYHRPGPVAR